MDKASRIVLGVLFGAVIYGISDPANAIIYGTLTFIIIYMIGG